MFYHPLWSTAHSKDCKSKPVESCDSQSVNNSLSTLCACYDAQSISDAKFISLPKTRLIGSFRFLPINCCFMRSLNNYFLRVRNPALVLLSSLITHRESPTSRKSASSSKECLHMRRATCSTDVRKWTGRRRWAAFMFPYISQAVGQISWIWSRNLTEYFQWFLVSPAELPRDPQWVVELRTRKRNTREHRFENVHSNLWKDYCVLYKNPGGNYLNACMDANWIQHSTYSPGFARPQPPCPLRGVGGCTRDGCLTPRVAHSKFIGSLCNRIWRTGNFWKGG